MTSVQAHPGYYPSAMPAARAEELAFTPDAASAEDTAATSLFGADGFTFGDLVDMVNPLQHIPIVSTFYRDQTGDSIAAAPRVVGSTLFFGPLGLVSALANIAVEEATGKDIGDNLASWAGLTHDDTEPSAEPAMRTAEGFDPDDPVSTWARGEADWARAGAAVPTSAPLPGEPQRTPSPDAGPLLAQQERWADRAEPDRPRPQDVAYLSADIQAASNAYRSVVGWSSEQVAVASRAL